MEQQYLEKCTFKTFFSNLMEKEIEAASADEFIDASQKLLNDYINAENARRILEYQTQIKDSRIRELEIQIMRQTYTPFRSGSPDPEPKKITDELDN
jgi:hypothetical protein